MSNNINGTSKARNLDMRPLRIMVAVVAFMWAFAPALRAAQPVRHLRPADRAVLVGDVSVPVEHYRHLPASRLTGWDFMLQADSLGFWPLDSAIVSEVLAGNVPYLNSLFLGAKAGLALTGVYTIAFYIANVVEARC